MKITLLVADEVRPEATGKQTVLGLFADNVVVVKIPPKPEEVPDDVPPGIERLAFLVNVSKLPEGQYDFKGQFISPSGERSGDVFQLGNAVQVSPGKSYSAVIESKPFILKEGGEYNLAFWINNEEHRLPFEIRIEPLA